MPQKTPIQTLAVNLTIRPVLLPEPVTVLARYDERLDHFRVNEVAIELIQLGQPEIVAVERCVW